jgi:hypothetical protein
MAWVELPGGVRLSALIVSIIVCTMTWFLILLLHGYQHGRENFQIARWAKERTAMFVVGFCATLAIAIIRGFTKDMAPLLSLFGLEPNKPGAAVTLGLAIAAFLLGFGPRLKERNDKKELPPNEKPYTTEIKPEKKP